MRRVSRRSLLGYQVLDCHGEEIGTVVDTWPDDGGWEVVMVVVRLHKFGGRRMLPLDDVVAWGGVMRAVFSRMQIEDAPAAEGGVHKAEDPYRALAHWRFEDQVSAAIVTPRWRRSSGFFAMERPFPTNPSPTPIAS